MKQRHILEIPPKAKKAAAAVVLAVAVATPVVVPTLTAASHDGAICRAVKDLKMHHDC